MGWLQSLAGKLRGGKASPPSAPPGPTARDQWQLTGVFFDTTGWTLTENTPAKMAWTHANGAQLTLSKASRPAADVVSTSLTELRQHCRARATAKNEGIVSVEPRSCGGVPAVEVITKYERPPGYGFIGRLEVNTDADEYLIYLGADERFTGAREAVVNMQRLALGEIPVEGMISGRKGPSAIPGMQFDPYDAGRDDAALNALSDDPRLDAVFPDHPLTFIRSVLAALCSSLECFAESPLRNPVTSVSGLVTGPRQLLSLAALREIYWQTGRNDLLLPALNGELGALDPAGTSTDAEVGRLLIMLGIVQQNTNNSLLSRVTFARAVKILEKVSGAGHRDTAVALVHLGRALLELGRPKEARETAERALAILDRDPAAAGVLLIAALTTQCQAMEQLGLLNEARPCLQRLVSLQSTMDKGLRSLHELAGGLASQVRGEVKIIRPTK